jgi:hypothetical protein
MDRGAGRYLLPANCIMYGLLVCKTCQATATVEKRQLQFGNAQILYRDTWSIAFCHAERQDVGQIEY